MNYDFKDKSETYLHYCAKMLIADKLKSQFLRVAIEEKFYSNGKILFIADIACYDENGLHSIYEIYHSHLLDCEKIKKIFQYQKENKHIFKIYELQALTVLLTI